MTKIRGLDFQKWAIASLLILWASATFSIALMEISFVCALIFWIGWHIQLKKGTGTFSATERRTDSSFGGLGTGSPAAGGVPVPIPINFRESEIGAAPTTINHQKTKVGTVPLQKGASPRTIDWVFWTPLSLFFILVLASYFTSEYPKQSLRGIFKIAKPLLVFIMAAGLFQHEKARRRFDLAFLITFLLVTMDSSIQYAFGKDLLRGFSAQDSSAGLRIVGPFGDFGKMSAYLIMVIPIFAMRLWCEFRHSGQRKKSLSALALATTACMLLYLTRCRGPVVALVFGMSCLLIYKRWFKAIGLSLLLFLVFLAVTPRGMIIHLNAEAKEQSLIERYYLWRRAIDVLVAKPLTGTGINTYAIAHDKYDKIQRKNLMLVNRASVKTIENLDGSVSFITSNDVLTSDEKRTTLWSSGKKYNLVREPDGKYYIYNELIVRGYYAHNGYLQLAAEIGLPGIFFFLLFLVMFFKRGLSAASSVRGSPEELEQLGILTGLLAFLIYALADTNLQSPQCLISFWFLAGFLLARQSEYPYNTRCLTSGPPNLTPGVENGKTS